MDWNMSNDRPGPRTVNCPTCAAIVEWSTAQAWRPFCSERCRLIDLGDWLDESHRIPAVESTPSGDETGTH